MLWMLGHTGHRYQGDGAWSIWVVATLAETGPFSHPGISDTWCLGSAVRGEEGHYPPSGCGE